MISRAAKVLAFVLFLTPNISMSGQIGHGWQDTLLIAEDSSQIQAHYYDSYSVSEVPLIIVLDNCGRLKRCAFEMVCAFADRFCWGRRTEIPDCPHFLEFDVEDKAVSDQGLKSMAGYVRKLISEGDTLSLDVNLTLAEKLKYDATRYDTNEVFLVSLISDANPAIELAIRLPLITKIVLVSPSSVDDKEQFLNLIKLYKNDLLLMTNSIDTASCEFANEIKANDTGRIETVSFLPGEKSFYLIFNNREKSKYEESMDYLVDWLTDFKNSRSKRN